MQTATVPPVINQIEINPFLCAPRSPSTLNPCDGRPSPTPRTKARDLCPAANSARAVASVARVWAALTFTPLLRSSPDGRLPLAGSYRKNTIDFFEKNGVRMQSYRALRDGKAFDDPQAEAQQHRARTW